MQTPHFVPRRFGPSQPPAEGPAHPAPAAHPTAQLAKRATALTRVDVPYCTAPAAVAGAMGDAAPPSWTLGLEGDALVARLARHAAADGTLAALDDPFGCGVARLPVQLAATAISLATAAPTNAKDAYTDYACGGTSDATRQWGFGLDADAAGNVVARGDVNATSSCRGGTPRAFVALATTPLTLQQAASPTQVPGLDWGMALSNASGNVTWNEGAAAVLCAPLLASALRTYNFSAPLASLEASLESNARTRFWQLLGPLGGVAALGLLSGLAAYLRQRRATPAVATDAGGKGTAANAADYVPMLPR